MKVRRIKSGSAVEFYINNEQTVSYNKKKGGVLGRYMNCAPLPGFSLLTSHLVQKLTNRYTRETLIKSQSQILQEFLYIASS